MAGGIVGEKHAHHGADTRLNCRAASALVESLSVDDRGPDGGGHAGLNAADPANEHSAATAFGVRPAGGRRPAAERGREKR
jgi:hypothetical protein